MMAALVRSGFRGMADYLQSANFSALLDFQALGHLAQQVHPIYEHFLTLLYASGAADAGEVTQFLNTSFPAASISTRSVIWA